MNWLDTLLKKLPTLKGITWFLHLATHWSSFRDELDRYRNEIKDRDEWLKAREEWLKTQATMHEAEKERMKNEFNQKVNEMMNAGARFRDIIKEVLQVHIESTLRLAIHYQLNPVEWFVAKEQLSPELRKEIERRMAELPPPPPAPKTLGELIGSLGGDTPLPLKIFESKAEAAAREERLELLQRMVSDRDKKKDEED